MKYLIQKNKRKTRAHLWDGNDTLCHQYSAGALKHDRHDIVDKASGRSVCKTCQLAARNAKKSRKAKNKKEPSIECPYCRHDAFRVTGDIVYPNRPDLSSKRFFLCYPCNAYVGCHADGKPLGRIANASLRRMKMKAHEAFDPKWKSGEMSRSGAYRWLAETLGMKLKHCHIGMFDERLCQLVIDVCNGKPIPTYDGPDFPKHELTLQPSGAYISEIYRFETSRWRA